MSVFKGLVTKEFREAFRDKRALMAAGMMILFGPLIFAGMIMFIISDAVDVKDSYVKFIGAENSPELIAQLNSKKIHSIDEVPQDELEKWTKREITLTIPEDFSQKLAKGQTVDVILLADYSNKNIKSLLSRIERTIEQYSSGIGSLRLLMRGIDPRIVTPINVEVQNTATPESNSALFMGMVSAFIIMSLFTASMTAAIDTSAGERERHSLELILCQPVSTLKVVLSKVVCVGFYGAVCSVLTMIALNVTMSMLPLEKLGMPVIVDPVSMGIITVMLIPLAYMASVLQLFFAYRSKSFKEAQSYLSMIVILPTMIPMIVSFMPYKPAWMNNLPLAGHTMLMEELNKGKSLDLLAYASVNIITIAVAVTMTILLAKSLRSEKVVLALD